MIPEYLNLVYPNTEFDVPRQRVFGVLLGLSTLSQTSDTSSRLKVAPFIPEVVNVIALYGPP